MLRYLTLLAILVILLSACGSNEPAPLSTPAENTSALAGTDLPDTPQPVTVTPTLTENPATSTPIPPTKTPTPTPTEALEPSGPEKYPEGYNPLTGKPVDNPELLERRPMAIKVQLYPRGGRPPWGVALADIVYDYYQNSGLTRLNAIFYGNDAEVVGPIRSARIFDEHIMRMYKAIFVFGGADWRVFNRIYDYDLRDRMVVEGSHNCPPMCRIDPNVNNYLVTNTEELGPYVVEKGVENGLQDLKGMSFNPETPEDGEPGEQIYVRWSIGAYVRWDYDPNSGSYLRYQDAVEDTGDGEYYEPFRDRLTEEHIAADNVIVIPLTHEDELPSKNIELMDIHLTGSGPAYAFRDGQVFEVEWNRTESDSVLYLTYPDGSPFPLKPGTTWFEVIGEFSNVEQEDGTEPEGIWRFTFRIP